MPKHHSKEGFKVFESQFGANVAFELILAHFFQKWDLLLINMRCDQNQQYIRF